MEMEPRKSARADRRRRVRQFIRRRRPRPHPLGAESAATITSRDSSYRDAPLTCGANARRPVLCHAACETGGKRHASKRVRFTTTTGLVTQLLEQRETRTLQRLHKQLERLDVLILDELGYVPFSKAGAELLFDVVSRAYERTSLIVTTNLPFEQWTEVMGSERLTGALLDRLTHRVHIMEANGQSYRLSDAKRRLKRK